MKYARFFFQNNQDNKNSAILIFGSPVVYNELQNRLIEMLFA
jgi:hypothetical protein